MFSRIKMLIDRAGQELYAPIREGDLSVTERAVPGLCEMLSRRNGFYAFDSALHVFPAGPAGLPGLSLGEWNADALWRSSYGDLADGCVFFAEDVFGGQFCAYLNAIYGFDPETGQKELIAGSVEEWAQAILDDPDVVLGSSLATSWQQVHGGIPAGMRLVPKIPFVLGGHYIVDNLYACDSVTGMNLRGEIACQIRSLPDGAKIRFDVVD